MASGVVNVTRPVPRHNLSRFREEVSGSVAPPVDLPIGDRCAPKWVRILAIDRRCLSAGRTKRCDASSKLVESVVETPLFTGAVHDKTSG